MTALLQIPGECDSERILKIGQHLTKLCVDYIGLLVFGPPCILRTDRQPIDDLIFGKISNGHISARGRPIHFMFGSTVGFSGRQIEWR